MNGAGVAAGSRRRHAQLMPIADGSSTNRHAVASGGPPAAQPRPPSLGAVRALLILNVQNDFFQGGAMPLPDAERILPIIARLRRTKKFDVVIISGTRHLPQHRRFCSNNPATYLHEKLPAPDGHALHMWPSVCLVGTEGSKFHPSLTIAPTDIVLHTGMLHQPQSQSAFEPLGPLVAVENRTDHVPKSELRTLLDDLRVTHLFICGLATDFAVEETALDAQLLPQDLQVFVIEDACEGVDEEASKEALRTMAVERVSVVASVSRAIAGLPNAKPPPPARPPPTTANGQGLRPVSTRMGLVGAAEGSSQRHGGGVDASALSALVESAFHGRDVELQAFVNHLTATSKPGVLNTLLPTTGEAALHVACAQGHLSCVRALIAAHANVNVRTRGGSTPLLLALFGGHTNVVLALLEAQAHPNLIETKTGLSPLMVASATSNIEAVRALLGATSGPGAGTARWKLQGSSMVDTQTKTGDTALGLACAVMGLYPTEHEWEYGVSQKSAVKQFDRNLDGTPRLGVVAMGQSMNPNDTAADSELRQAMNLERLHRASEIVSMLLSALPSSQRRLKALRTQNRDGWAPIHFAAKSGLLAMIDWTLLQREMVHLPVNLPTNDGITMLHLASWNGRAASIALLLGAWPDARMQATSNPWRGRARVNAPVRGRRHLELDLALMRGFVDCARLLLRAGCVANVFRGDKTDEFLHRLILLGDGVGAELLMRSGNDVKVQPVLVEILQRMKYPDSCTFTFATYQKPVSQHMYECTVCDVKVCVTCASKCHKARMWQHTAGEHQHQLVYMGFQRSTFCGCVKSTCCALAVVDQREVEGYRYQPTPIDTSGVTVDLDTGSELGVAVNKLARNSHEVWAAQRIDQGWRYGPSRDDAMRLHPLLVEWERLDEESKKYDLESAAEAVKVALALGYTITRVEDVDSDESDAMDITPPNETYTPKPINTHGVDLSPELLALVELLARNVHEVWAAGKLAAKWKYMPERAVADLPAGAAGAGNTSSMLVPYEFLTEKEKASSRSSAMEMVRTLLQLGFEFQLGEGVTAIDPSSLSDQMTDLALQAMRDRIEQLADFKQGVLNACLFWAARKGAVDTIPLLMGSSDTQAGTSRQIRAQINCTDEMRRTPLYLAVQNHQKEVVKLLVDFAADLEVADLNGTTALSAASFLGYVDIADLLVEHGALYMVRDRISMTPIHYAAFAGHVKVVELLAKKLSVRGKPGVDFAFEGRGRLSAMLFSKTRQFARYLSTNQPGSGDGHDSNDDNQRRRSQTVDELVSSHASSAADLSPLTIAVHARQFKVAKLLLAFGANPLHKDGSGTSPHDRALLDHAEAEELAQELADTRSADVDSNVLKAFTTVSHYADTHSAETKKDMSGWDVAKTAFQLDRLKAHTEASNKDRTPQRGARNTNVAAERMRVAEVERAIALAEHAREQAVTKSQREAQHAARMVRVLSKSKEVQRERVSFAWKALVKQMLAFVVLMAVFGIMTPTAHDYGSRKLALFQGDMYTELSESFEFDEHAVEIAGGAYGITPDLWWQWIDKNVLWIDPPSGTLQATPYSSAALQALSVDSEGALFGPDLSGNGTVIGDVNLVVGAMRLRKKFAYDTPCTIPDGVTNFPEFKCYEHSKDNPKLENGGDLYITLSSGSVAARRAALAAYRPSDEFIYSEAGGAEAAEPLLSVDTQWLVLDASVYNPMVRAFAPFRIEVRASRAGSYLSIVDIQGAILFNGRFQPSLVFQLVLGLVIFVQALLMCRDALRIGARKWLGNGWNVYEVVTWLGFFLILGMDIRTKRLVDDLHLDMASTDAYVDVWGTVFFFGIERDILAVVLLLLVVRFIKYLRLTPGWGPMVVAIIMTWRDPSVLLYLGVSIVLTFAFAISFHVAFGSQSPQFSSLLNSFVSLFNMGFANDWGQMSQISQKALVVAFFLFYVLYAIVLLNLFIGIVTDVYPRAAERSTAQWEASITALMEDVVRQKRKALLNPGFGSWLKWLQCCQRCQRPQPGAEEGATTAGKAYATRSPTPPPTPGGPNQDAPVSTKQRPVLKLPAIHEQASSRHGSTRDVLTARDEHPSTHSSSMRKVLLTNLHKQRTVDLDKISAGSPGAARHRGLSTPHRTIASVDKAQAERFVETSTAVVPHRVSLSMASLDSVADQASAWTQAQERFAARMGQDGGAGGAGAGAAPKPALPGCVLSPAPNATKPRANADGAAAVVAVDFHGSPLRTPSGSTASKDFSSSGDAKAEDTSGDDTTFNTPRRVASSAKLAPTLSHKSLNRMSRLNQEFDPSQPAVMSATLQELEQERQRLGLGSPTSPTASDTLSMGGEETKQAGSHRTATSSRRSMFRSQRPLHPVLAAHQLGELTLKALKKVAHAMRADVHWGARNYDASKKSSGPSPLNRRTSTMDNIMATESSDDDSDEEDDQASSRPKALHRAESQLHSFMHLVRHRLGAQDDSMRNMEENINGLVSAVKNLADSVNGDGAGASRRRNSHGPPPHRRASYVQRPPPQPYRPGRGNSARGPPRGGHPPQGLRKRSTSVSNGT